MSRSRTRVYIGRLKEGVVTTNDLHDLFGRFGRIVDVQLKGNYGFVEFDTNDQADAAVYEMNRREFMGDRLIVEHAKEDTKRGPPAPPARRRSPSPRGPPPSRYYDSVPSLFGGGPSYPPGPHSYGGGYGGPSSQYSGRSGGYPPEPMPSYRPYDSADNYPPRRDWSPPRSAPRSAPRRRSRSRSPAFRGGSAKRTRRSSPLRIQRKRSPARSSEKPKAPSVGSRFDEKTTRRTSWRILIENLTTSTTWQDLRRHFDEIGAVVYASVASDASGFVEFSRRDMVAKAIEKLNNTLLKGVRIQVMNAIPPGEDVPQADEPQENGEDQNESENLDKHVQEDANGNGNGHHSEPADEDDLSRDQEHAHNGSDAGGLDNEHVNDELAPDFGTSSLGAEDPPNNLEMLAANGQ